jgi:hypothetical protein
VTDDLSAAGERQAECPTLFWLVFADHADEKPSFISHLSKRLLSLDQVAPAVVVQIAPFSALEFLRVPFLRAQRETSSRSFTHVQLDAATSDCEGRASVSHDFESKRIVDIRIRDFDGSVVLLGHRSASEMMEISLSVRQGSPAPRRSWSIRN